jgi:hypothetical protein
MIESDRLKVELAEPGKAPNTTTRFDRAGFVTQITLDDKHRFCTREPDNLVHPCTGGYGLCNAMDLQNVADETPVGNQFPKLGIGLLTKDYDGRYIFHHDHPCEPYDISYESTTSDITFYTKPNPCMGYAAMQTKKLEVIDNELVMTITMANVGEQPLVFSEFCHNFLTIDHLPIGENYYLSMPIAPQDGNDSMRGGALVGKDNGFTFKCYSDSPCMVFVENDDILSKDFFSWKLTNSVSPAWVSEEVSLNPSKVVVWSIDHIISPEVICNFNILPGETVSWTRKWTFDC